MEIRTYDGTAEDLQAFVVAAWRKTYAGKMAFPLWTPQYLTWQLGLDLPTGREQHLAAYEGTRLVGCVFGIPLRFAAGDQEFLGTQGSWLSVDPEFRRLGVAAKLRDEMRRRDREQGRDFQLGYIYRGSKFSLGPHFWQKHREHGTIPIQRVGFWARILDIPRSSRWYVNWLDRVTSPALYLWLRKLKPSKELQDQAAPSTLPGCRIRPYRAEDLPACLAIWTEASQKYDFRIVWEASNLQRQLEGGGVGRCLVAEKNGTVQGFVSYHVLPFLGLTEEPVGIVDMIALARLNPTERRCLLESALYDMKMSGAILALKVRIGDYPLSTVLSSGFVFRPTDSDAILTWGHEPRQLPPIRTMHVLWR